MVVQSASVLAILSATRAYVDVFLLRADCIGNVSQHSHQSLRPALILRVVLFPRENQPLGELQDPLSQGDSNLDAIEAFDVG